MSKGFRETDNIIKQERIASDVMSMWIATKEIAKNAVPGQFISVYSTDGKRLLPRPISICEIDGDALRIVYRTVGAGTREFSEFTSEHKITIQGPLGNGYLIDNEKLKGKKAVLFGGGIGIPPMLELAKNITCEKSIMLGYRDELFLNDEFEKFGNVYIATEDGSAGTKGNVLDAVKANNIEADIIFACGPTPMLRAIKAYALENDIEAYISMEEKMACGIGACLACVCKSTEIDDHSKVNNKRVCKEGPVFNVKEVEI